MSLMDRVVSARGTLQEANNALSGARGIIPPLRPPQTLVEISSELNSEVLTGAGEALWEMGSDLWNTVTNPIGSVVDALEGAQELLDDPIGTAQEVWEDFTEPYVEDWENGREGEAIGRGLVELGANFIPGYNVIRWLNRFDDANSDDGPEVLEASPSESGSSGGNELPEGDPPSSDSDGPIDDPPGGDPPAAGSDESDDESDDDNNSSNPDNRPGDDATTPGGRPLTNHAAQESLSRHGFHDLSRVDDIIDNPSYTRTQADGAEVYIQRNPGRQRTYDIVIAGDEGIVTGIRGLSPAELRRLEANYGWY
jgi:hypothetical protein